MIFYIHSNNTLLYLPCPGLSPLKNKLNFCFFTLGSIYSTNASGAKQTPETNKFESNIHVNGLRILIGQRQTSWLLASVVVDLNTWLARKNPVKGQGGTWTWGLRIASPVLWPLSHVASFKTKVALYIALFEYVFWNYTKLNLGIISSWYVLTS